MIRVIICGAAGQVGQQLVESFSHEPDIETVGLVDIGTIPTSLKPFAPRAICTDNLGSAIERSNPEVIVDFTVASAARGNISLAIDRGVSPVVGTTGLSDEDIDLLRTKADKAGVGAFIAPNFAIGAVILMRLSEIAASHFDHIEII